MKYWPNVLKLLFRYLHSVWLCEDWRECLILVHWSFVMVCVCVCLISYTVHCFCCSLSLSFLLHSYISIPHTVLCAFINLIFIYISSHIISISNKFQKLQRRLICERETGIMYTYILRVWNDRRMIGLHLCITLHPNENASFKIRSIHSIGRIEENENNCCKHTHTQSTSRVRVDSGNSISISSCRWS